ncbi:hypothetical protein [Halobacillus dabanensis]|uniref:hypothetical protein n=1 Tax=Halobacillus dabanensis TaxID=240302 RepID=UPI001428B7C9|nr:hypothetical protein [Halobacillus dabanensis]
MERQVSITDTGLSMGLTYADFRPVPQYIKGYPMHKIIIDFNRDAFIKDFIQVMTK